MQHAGESMRILNHILFPVVFLILILPVIILPPQISGSPDEIIPTRNLLILNDYPDDSANVTVDSVNGMAISEPVAAPSQSAPNVSLPVPAGFIAPVARQAEQPVSTPPDPGSFGKGWVQVNLHTAVDSPDQMIEDRQRYMASGLFNVHVYHQFAG